MLAAAVAFGISLVMVKSLTRSDSVVKIIFWMLVIQSAIGLYPALAVWKTPPADLWPWIFLIAFTGMSSHFCMARALVHTDATVISTMDFPPRANVGADRLDALQRADRHLHRWRSASDTGGQPAQSSGTAQRSRWRSRIETS